MKRDEVRIGNVNVKCFCCGRMIPGEPTRRRVEGAERLFCEEGCYDFFLKYQEIKSKQVVK